MPGSNNHSTLEEQELEQPLQPQQPPQSPATTILPTDDGSQKQSGGSYDDIITSIQKEIDDMESRHKEEQKIDAVVAAINGIGDMGRALGNIYAANNYVPSTFNPQNTASAKYGERAAKAQAEYDKNRTAMMHYLNTAKKEKANFNFNQEKQNLAQKKWEAEEEGKNALNQARVESYNAMTKYRDAMANRNEAQAKLYEEQMLYFQAKQKYLELGYNLKQAESQARIDAKEALADKRRREANGTTTSTTIDRDRFGNETGRNVTRTPNGGTGNTGNNNTPPSRQKGGNNDNTPPSRRK